ncbi:MAG: hypothetical protein ABII12_15910 [Planctomycetota bacterium]
MDLFGVRRVPFMARRNYIIEVQHLFLWGIFAGMFEGTVSSIVVAKTFDAEPWLITIVMATPMFSNLMGLAWGAAATGRRKLPLFALFAAASSAMIGSVALTPASSLGGWIFAGQILVARMMLSGCVTVRSSLWKHNYPSIERGRIVARLQFVRFSFAVATVTCVSLLFDRNPLIYVWVYPAVAMIGCAAILAIRRTHVRGEVVELKHIAEKAAAIPRGSLRSRLLHPVVAGIEVLRADPAFARYSLGMMFLGAGNMMIMPIMTIMITKQLHLSYYHSCNLMDVLPRMMMMGSLILWAGLFDRVGVVRFRVLNACVWVSGIVAGGIAAVIIYFTDYMDSVPLFATAVTFVALSRIGQGFGMGGGAIAWNLGHLHFAEPEKAEVYMGVHVFLAGVRGLAAPFLGTFLYTVNGPLAFAVALSSGVVAIGIFILLARAERRAQKKHGAGD